MARMAITGRANSDLFRRNLSLEKRFAKQIRAILGCQFFIQDPVLDQRCATDFAIFTAPRQIRVGVRLRRYQYWLRYRRQFTIRWSLPSGVRTEIDKIRDGLVNYFLYGFLDAAEYRIIQYFIGDLDVFRKCKPEPVSIHENSPPDSKLAVYSLSQLPPEFVLKVWPADAFSNGAPAKEKTIPAGPAKQLTLFEIIQQDR